MFGDLHLSLMSGFCPNCGAHCALQKKLLLQQCGAVCSAETTVAAKEGAVLGVAGMTCTWEHITEPKDV